MLKNIFHRVELPAIGIIDDDNDKFQEWYKDGKLHREDGPAVITPLNTQYWCKYGLLHREDGPAVKHADGREFCHLNGKEVSQKEFIQLIKLKAFLVI